MNNEADVGSEISEAESRVSNEPTVVNGMDYYLENGLMVFTENFLRRRGYCCDSGCRHCPYENGQNPLP